ncbi:MAG TPA: ParB N-terminal domain-containing protein [Kiritimatiellia bacterium]|nr:ParB N-terminal domain-containing protein [Kiritimatiellia bacterium]HMO99641.1 ParB N-terminal domain-containing protein [Kiritimatiellia bacterium]HMP97112.1 ParB N-terminal domain-containing protein [Kiritimatiellia bacterium]
MKRKTTELNPHPKLKHFPMLSEEKYAALVLSIRQNGLLKNIVITDDGKVIDGRNRLKAALELQLEYVPVEVRDDVDPVVYAIESAATGRQLTKTGVCLLLLDQHPDLSECRAERKGGRKVAGETVQKMNSSFRDIANLYQVPFQYFTYILNCMALCRNRHDEERLRVMVYELETSAVNLEKGILGWQASHPIDEDVSDEDLHGEPVAKRSEPKPDAILIRSFDSIMAQSANWSKIRSDAQRVIRDQFIAMWKLLPDELRKAVK